jgi:hypothetical protein
MALTPRKRDDELAKDFTEFVEKFASAAEGRTHLAHYLSNRAEGMKNFAEVTAAKDRGDDITELVITKLLPHGESKGNRTRGAWISIAPVITKEIKEWFAGAGWAAAGDWPKISAAIFELLQHCKREPKRLGEWCDGFASEGFVGIQAGVLSPILNAINPTEFPIFNNKPRVVLEYYFDEKITTKIRDYPKAVRAVKSAYEALPASARALAFVDVPAVDVFDMFSHWVVAIKKKRLKDPRYWKIAPGEKARLWKECLAGNFISMGWGDIGDVSDLERSEFDLRVRDGVKKGYWKADGAEQVWTFAKDIFEGDYIVANNGTTEVIGIGRVSGPYYYVKGAEHPHRLPVDWDGEFKSRQVSEGGWRRTLIKLNQEKFGKILGSPASGVDGSLPPITPSPPAGPYTLEQLSNETYLPLDLLNTWIDGIKRRRQAIIYGPPGTGKTFVAERLARFLVASGSGRMELVQFHPAYTYEDFIQGIRPITRDGRVSYETMPGRFLDFCRQAEKTDDLCVLIIDEINRANLPRVFGELMYLLEYRDRQVPMASGGSLAVPKNVIIVGTMNTADRSIALVDHALRRRFSFLALHPKFEVLQGYHEKTGYKVDSLIAVLREINNAIDDYHYSLGISFFLRPDLEVQLPNIWQMEIEPYLEEYFCAQRDRSLLDSFRWDKVRDRLQVTNS